LQSPPKFTQIWIFGLKNMPSGNPALDLNNCDMCRIGESGVKKLLLAAAGIFFSSVQEDERA
jgi:hypothetical protein